MKTEDLDIKLLNAIRRWIEYLKQKRVIVEKRKGIELSEYYILIKEILNLINNNNKGVKK